MFAGKACIYSGYHLFPGDRKGECNKRLSGYQAIRLGGGGMEMVMEARLSHIAALQTPPRHGRTNHRLVSRSCEHS